MNENQIGTIIVDCAVQLHRALGSGLLETVYEVTLLRRLKLGYLLNFGEALMKDGITRIINGQL